MKDGKLAAPSGEPKYYAHRIERSLEDLPDEYISLHRDFLSDAAKTIRLNMNVICELRTEIARLSNENARLNGV